MADSLCCFYLIFNQSFRSNTCSN